MNIRDLINRIESIELNEGLRLKDIEAQVSNEPNEQKRAQILMTLAQTNKLPGLYDPVSGYFVSAEPDTQGEWQGAGTPAKPRISATGTEDQDALLAKRGLVPPKANTSTFLRHLNPFSSSNKDYDAGVQGGSQAAIARQNKEDEELKQLTSLIPKYKELKAKLSALNGESSNADTGHEVVPTGKYLSEALIESFRDLFETDDHSTILNTAPQDITLDTAIITLPNGDIVYDMQDLAFDLGMAGVGFAVGMALTPFTAGASAVAGSTVAATRLVKIGRAMGKWGKTAVQNIKDPAELKIVAKQKAVDAGKKLGTQTLAVDVPTTMGLNQAANVYDRNKDNIKASTSDMDFNLFESMSSLKQKLILIERNEQISEGPFIKGLLGNAEKDAAKGTAVVPRDPLQDILPPLPNRVGEFVPPKPPDISDVTGRMKPNQPLMITYTKPPRPDITPQQWATGVPDAMKPSAWQWLKDNPKKSLAAAVALLAAGGSLVGGGQGNRGKDQVPGQVATAPTNPNAAGKPDSSTTYQIQRGDTLSRIAQQNSVSVAELMAANPSIINPNNITAGATITIPPASGKPVYDQGVGSKPNTMPYDAPNPTKPDSDADAEAEDKAKKQAEIEATQKEIDTAKQQLAALIVDLEKSEDEDNIRQLKDLESQLDDLDDIKALNANNPSASNYTNQMDQASDAATEKKTQANNPSSANYTNQMDRASDAASSKPAEAPKLTAKDSTTPVAGDKEGAAMDSKGEISYPGKGPNYKPEYDPQHTGNPLYKQEPASTTDYSVASAPNAKNAKLNAMKESDDELARWLRIANIK